jgi:hypothetical protein
MLDVDYGTYDEQGEPEQRAQAARKGLTSGVQHAPEEKAFSGPEKKQREITLTLGIFFDGTGNNAVNTHNMQQVCSANYFGFSDPDAEALWRRCADDSFGVSGNSATSYLGHYTNVHWLATLYKTRFTSEDNELQDSLYIEGVGTKSGAPDSVLGQAFGTSDTGVIAKTDNAVTRIAEAIQRVLAEIKRESTDEKVVINSLHFDLFGFSRGAAAARHFANRIHSEESAIIDAVRQGLGDTLYHGAPAGKIRFIGIMDTVAAIGTPANGLNPHTADTGDVNIMLRSGVAEKVFHITAANECRFNFALNSVKPAWPELSLPGAHSDIGGGYLPISMENLFLTRPETDTVFTRLPGEQTRGYRYSIQQMSVLDQAPTMTPIMRTSEVSAETWFDDRLPSDRYGVPQKRNYAAITLRNRKVKNDWSKVVLRVMLNAAQEAGVLFDPIDPENADLTLPRELISFCQKAIAMGKAVRSGNIGSPFNQAELDIIAEQYIHCSAHWNAIVSNHQGLIQGGAALSKLIGFVNRPDENWLRTIYDMDGRKL